MGTSYTPTVQPTPQQCTPLSSSPLSPAPWPSPRWCPMSTRRSLLNPTSTRRSPLSPMSTLSPPLPPRLWARLSPPPPLSTPALSSPGLEAVLITSELECLADRLKRSESIGEEERREGGLRQSPVITPIQDW